MYGTPEPAAAATGLSVSAPREHFQFQRTPDVRHRTMATAASRAPPHRPSRIQRQFMWPVRSAQGAGHATAAPRSNVEADSNGGLGSVPACSEAINALEEMTAGEAKGEEYCSVCLEDFDEGDKRRMMPCSHAFHVSCISGWLGLSRLCPLCRFALPTDAEL